VTILAKPIKKNYPIKGSENVAIKLIKFASDKKLNIFAHYCSVNTRFTSLLINIEKLLESNRKSHETPCEFTVDSGYKYKILKKFLIVYHPDIEKALKDLKQKKIDRKKYYLNSDLKRLEIHISSLKYLDHKKYDIALVKSDYESNDVFLYPLIGIKNFRDL